ncbi:MAG: DPP IV N-terminal domain-containing protein [Planctomycetota bacterium]
MPLLILILAASATGQVPTYQLETILPSPHCTSVDLSPDGTKLCARMQYGDWNEGYRVFDADTYDILNDCGGHWAPWCGQVSTDSTYLYTTLYYRGCVAKLELSTCAEPICIPVGPWPYYLTFDPARRFLYVGVNAPYAGAIGSVKVIDTTTETVVGSVGLDGTPGKCMLVSSDGGFLYMLSWRSDARQTLYKISTSNYSIADTLLLDNASHPGISISPDGATVYVPYPDAELVYIIDTGTLDIVGTWSIDSPHGFFASPDGTHALITGHSEPDIRVFDLLTETVVQTIDVGDIGTYIPNLSNPYWDKNNGKVYVNLGATEGGVAVLVPEPEPLTGRIAFSSYHPGEPMRLWVMDVSAGLSSKMEVPLPQTFRVLDSTEWSRDGTWILFHAAKPGEWNLGVYIVKPDGSSFCQVTPDGMNLAHPSFSPDASQIVGCSTSSMSICTKIGECDWMTEYLTGGVHPRWSPDGNKITYSNWGQTYESDIFVYDLNTNTSTKLTNHVPGEPLNLAVWSPDGTKLAVAQNDRVKYDICIMNSDGSGLWNLTADWATSDERYPSWSPDGQYIVFTSDISGNSDIWYTPADHFAPVNITNSPEDEYMVAITTPEPTIEAAVDIDIKPGSCPNPLNVKSKGVLPVAILGSEDFDVHSVDVASIRLAGVAPIRSSYEDVTTLFSDSNECECSTEGPDGYLDLTIKFETQKIVEALGEVDHDDELVLELTGVLSDETPIEESDCVIIRGKHKPINPADINKDGVVNIVDFSMVADNWLQSSIIKD